ncbi:MAG: hypothetical protein PHO66_05485 [Eubacteriales bacterium]|nr:hypothetical protein [Eubacteriales bacterium]
MKKFKKWMLFALALGLLTTCACRPPFGGPYRRRESSRPTSRHNRRRDSIQRAGKNRPIGRHDTGENQRAGKDQPAGRHNTGENLCTGKNFCAGHHDAGGNLCAGQTYQPFGYGRRRAEDYQAARVA